MKPRNNLPCNSYRYGDSAIHASDSGYWTAESWKAHITGGSNRWAFARGRLIEINEYGPRWEYEFKSPLTAALFYRMAVEAGKGAELCEK